MGHSPKGRHKQVDFNPDSLCSEIPISLLITRSSRICSHQ